MLFFDFLFGILLWLNFSLLLFSFSTSLKLTASFLYEICHKAYQKAEMKQNYEIFIAILKKKSLFFKGISERFLVSI